MTNYDSDDSTSSVTQSSSLQSELKKIVETVKQLDKFKPELKRKVGRPASKPAVPSTPKKTESTVPDILFKICSLTQKVLDRFTELEQENNSLRSRVDNLESASGEGTLEAHSSDSTFASVVAGKKIPTGKAINQIDTRLDQVEQSSLTTTIKLDGELIAEKIEKFSKEKTKNYSELNNFVVDQINRVSPDILEEEEVVSVAIFGKEKKHLKVKLGENLTKIKILKTFKEKKPTNFYISQYLTKNRALSLYRLKKIKQNNSNIESAYCYSGNICCRLTESNQVFYLNSSSSIDNFISEHNLNE